MPRPYLYALAFPFLSMVACDARARPTSPSVAIALGPDAGPGFLPMPKRDAAAYAEIDWLHIPREKYESSLTSYVVRVRPGNQVALKESVWHWAHYLNAVHNQIHPAFADGFLANLDNRGADDPLNKQQLFTSLEVVVDSSGRLSALGVAHSSGELGFDLAALEAVTRSSPFPRPPADILSPDGNAYFHWEFHRDEVFACSTMNARPFILALPTTEPAVHD